MQWRVGFLLKLPVLDEIRNWLLSPEIDLQAGEEWIKQKTNKAYFL